MANICTMDMGKAFQKFKPKQIVGPQDNDENNRIAAAKRTIAERQFSREMKKS